ncbi:MAG: hypothetical protein JSR62_17740 [Nitrospira sp.]|nr:hypothetical protein [Nitrospira sp.]
MRVYYAPYGTAWTLHGYQLVDRATGQYKVTPTLAAGDFKLEKDGGAAANIATLPVVAPAGGSSLDIAFSAAELQAKHVVLRLVDAAGAEWNDDAIHIFTVGDPNAFFEFDLFSGSVALSLASQSSVTGGVWDELVANHLMPATFGAHQADTGAAVTDIQAKVLELKTLIEDLTSSLGGGSATTVEALSQVRVANLALQKLGAQEIVSMDEDTRERRAITRCYTMLRDRELRAHNWNFSIRRAVLAPSTVAPLFEFAKAFPLPADCLRPLPPSRDVDWTIEYHEGSKHILTNEGTVIYLRYVSRVTDETQFDPLFADMLACKIAWHCCEEITQSNQKKADIEREYDKAKADAKRINAFEQATPQEPEPPWLTARYAGDRGQNWLRFGGV